MCQAMACGISQSYDGDGSTQSRPWNVGGSEHHASNLLCRPFTNSLIACGAQAALLPYYICGQSAGALLFVPRYTSRSCRRRRRLKVIPSPTTQRVGCPRLLNIATLARERRSSAAALLGAWITQARISKPRCQKWFLCQMQKWRPGARPILGTVGAGGVVPHSLLLPTVFLPVLPGAEEAHLLEAAKSIIQALVL